MRLFNFFKKRSTAEDPNNKLTGAFLNQILSDYDVAGITVTSSNALTSSTVFACVRIISETLASLPLTLYRRDGRKKEPAYDHPLYWLLHTEPNNIQSSFQWRESQQAKLLLWGNGYSEIERNQAGKPIALWPMESSSTTVKVSARKKFINSTSNGTSVTLPDADCLHIPGFGINGLTGVNPVTTNKTAIGLGMAAEKHSEQLFKNGVRGSGVLQTPDALSDTAYARLKNTFAEQYGGIDNAGKPILLEEGTKWEKMGMSPVEAELLGARKFQVSEVARIFNVPSHMIGDLERATNNNIEQLSLEFVKYSINSWLVRWEQELNRKLLATSEREKYYFKFNLDALLRGDQKSRFESYRTGRMIGMYSTNEIREKEDMNPIDHGDDDYLVALNMGDASEPNENNTNNTNNGDDDAKETSK